MIEKGKLVTVHYTGTTDGVIFDSSLNSEPIKFQIGTGQIIEGFESAIMGKVIGDKVTANIEPSEAYGEYRPELVIEVDINQMPEGIEVGQSLSAENEEGMSVNVRVIKVTEKLVTVDGNHDLAGKSLTFDIEVVNVEEV